MITNTLLSFKFTKSFISISIYLCNRMIVLDFFFFNKDEELLFVDWRERERETYKTDSWFMSKKELSLESDKPFSEPQPHHSLVKWP